MARMQCLVANFSVPARFSSDAKFSFTLFSLDAQFWVLDELRVRRKIPNVVEFHNCASNENHAVMVETTTAP